MAKAVARFDLKEIEVSGRRAVTVRLPPECFSVLTQVRQTYKIDEDLIPSILQKGQLTQGMAAALPASEAKRYVAEINLIYGSKHEFEELTPIDLDGKRYYLIIFAGHRRHLTIIHINECIASGDYRPSNKYNPGYLADLYFGIKAEEAIELQFHENRHSSVLPHEEASAAWRYYRFLKNKNPEFKPGQFAKRIGRSAGWVRDALRFCSLPDKIQSYVTGDNEYKFKLPYGSLVDLARLAEEYPRITGTSLPEEGMTMWVREAVAGQLNATAFGRKVSGYLEDLRAQEAGQFSLFDTKETNVEHTERTRKVVAREMVPALWRFIQYMKQVQHLYEMNQLGHESYLGPYLSDEQGYFSPGSPIRLTANLTVLLVSLGPHLAEISRLERLGHFKRLKALHPELGQISKRLKELALAEEVSAAKPPH